MNDIRIMNEIAGKGNMPDVRKRWKRLDAERKREVMRIVAGECNPARILEAIAAVTSGNQKLFYERSN